MADNDIRSLERAAAHGDPAAVAALRRARVRAGLVPVAGEYVRIDGSRIGRPDLTGNWRVSVVRRDPLTRDAVAVLSLVRHDRSISSPGLRSVLAHLVTEGRVPYDAPINADDATMSIMAPCPLCKQDAGWPCVSRSGDQREDTHARRKGAPVPHLQPPPDPLPIHVGEARERPSVVKVIESRNPNADLRITRDELSAASTAAEATPGEPNNDGADQ